MKKYAKVTNQQTKQCSIALGTDTDWFIKNGYREQEVEQAYNGQWYLKGYAPQEPENEKIQKLITELERQQTPRLLRNASLGEEYSINKLREIENAIAELREQL